MESEKKVITIAVTINELILIKKMVGWFLDEMINKEGPTGWEDEKKIYFQLDDIVEEAENDH